MENAALTQQLCLKFLISRTKADLLAKELIERFLPIKRHLQDFDDEICSASPLIYDAWRELILMTKLYSNICGKTFIHHDSNVELDSVEVKAKRYLKTLEAYEDLFGTRPDDSNIWPSVYPGLVRTESLSDEGNHNETARLAAVAERPPTPHVNKKRKTTSASAKTNRRSTRSTPSEPQTPTTTHASTRSTRLLTSQRIVVRTLTGRMIDLEVWPFETIYELKTKVHRIHGTSAPDKQRLIFNCIQLEDERAVCDYDIAEGDVVHLIERLSGC